MAAIESSPTVESPSGWKPYADDTHGGKIIHESEDPQKPHIVLVD